MEISLFERLGREKVLFQVVEEFYNLVLQDHRVSGFFADVDMVRLRQHQLSFLSALLGGPESYSGRSMRSAHRTLQLKEHHFQAIADNLSEALRRFGVSEDDIVAVLQKVSAYQGEIVTA